MPRILRLPDHGRLLVCTDLQGNLRDFQQMARHFRAAGPDAQLVLTGDLVHGPDDATVASWPDHLGTPYRDERKVYVELDLAGRCETVNALREGVEIKPLWPR